MAHRLPRHEFALQPGRVQDVERECSWWTASSAPIQHRHAAGRIASDRLLQKRAPGRTSAPNASASRRRGSRWLQLDGTPYSLPMNFYVEGGKVVNEGPMDNVEELVLAQTATFVDKPITGTYYGRGKLTVAGPLWFGRNGPARDGHYGVFNQSGGTADVSVLGGTWGELEADGRAVETGHGCHAGRKRGHLLAGRRAAGAQISGVDRDPGPDGLPRHRRRHDLRARGPDQSIQLTDTAPAAGRGGFVKEGEGMLWLSNGCVHGTSESARGPARSPRPAASRRARTW